MTPRKNLPPKELRKAFNQLFWHLNAIEKSLNSAHLAAQSLLQLASNGQLDDDLPEEPPTG